MRGKIIGKIITAAAIAMSFAAPRAYADQSLAALLSSTTSTISAGEPVYVSYEVENQSSKPVRLPAHFFGPLSSDGSGMFFNIVGDDNKPIDSSCAAPAVEYPDATIVIQPGEFHGRKTFNLSECYKFLDPGEYTIAAQFSSRAKNPDVWHGILTTNSVKIKVRESDARKRAKIADALIAQWLTNYDYTTAAAYKQKILSLDTPAAIPVAAALKRERRLLPVNDLLDLLGGFACVESADALIGFVTNTDSYSFVSNMPEGFSSSSIIRETAFRSLEKIFAKSFNDEDGDVTKQWTDWVAKHRAQLPPAIPADFDTASPGKTAVPPIATPKKQTSAQTETYPLIPEPKEEKTTSSGGRITKPKNGGKIK